MNYLSEIPIKIDALNEVSELAQVMMCENIDEIESWLQDRNESVTKIEDIKEMLDNRVDLDK